MTNTSECVGSERAGQREERRRAHNFSISLTNIFEAFPWRPLRDAKAVAGRVRGRGGGRSRPVGFFPAEVCGWSLSRMSVEAPASLSAAGFTVKCSDKGDGCLSTMSFSGARLDRGSIGSRPSFVERNRRSRLLRPPALSGAGWHDDQT